MSQVKYNPVSPIDFNVENVIIEGPSMTTNKKTGKQSLTAKLKYKYSDGRVRDLYLMSPAGIVTPFGLSSYEGSVDYSLTLTKESIYEDSSEELDNFFDQLQLLDQKMVQWGVENNIKILNKEYSEELVKAFYSHCVKINKKSDGVPYPPTFTCKIYNNKETGNPNVQFSYIEDAKDDFSIPVKNVTWDKLAECFPKKVKTSLSIVVQPQIWMISGKFGTKFSSKSILYIRTKDGSEEADTIWSNTIRKENKLMKSLGKSASSSPVEPEVLKEKLTESKQFSSEESEEDDETDEVDEVEDSEEETPSASAASF